MRAADVNAAGAVAAAVVVAMTAYAGTDAGRCGASRRDSDRGRQQLQRATRVQQGHPAICYFSIIVVEGGTPIYVHSRSI